MYVLNAEELELDLILFKPSVQKYLSETARVPFIKKKGDNMFFRKTRLLKDAIAKAPLWVKEIIGEEAKIIE